MFGPATKEGATRGQPVINKWRDPVPIKGADLYLINPSGIVFGQNATINVSGSFHASTRLSEKCRTTRGSRQPIPASAH
jgi:hypothetical protein